MCWDKNKRLSIGITNEAEMRLMNRFVLTSKPTNTTRLFTIMTKRFQNISLGQLIASEAIEKVSITEKAVSDKHCAVLEGLLWLHIKEVRLETKSFKIDLLSIMLNLDSTVLKPLEPNIEQ